MRTLSGLLVVLLLAVTDVMASTTAISIDGITGLIRNDSAEAGAVLGFRIRYTNTSDTGFNITNGFVVYSPEGASWTDSAFGNFHGANLGPIGLDTTGLLSKAQFPTVFALRTFSSTTTVARADGISPDTVAFSGVGNDIGTGLPPHLDVHVFTILIHTNPADSNKTICLDSTMRYPSTNKWKWAVLYGGPTPDTLIPGWGGLRCVQLVGKVWDPIQFTCPSTQTHSHCTTFTYDFNATIPNGTPADIHYQLASGPGTIDSLTGVWNGGLLAPGSHSITVRAVNIHNGSFASCTVPIVATDVRPLFSASGYQATCVVNKLSTFTPTVSGDCDARTFTLLGTDGAIGPSSINSSTGVLSFTPASADTARTDPIDMTIMVQDLYLSDTATVTWHFTGGCYGVRGNVDCDPNESVDIGDLTILLDYLFLGFGTLCSIEEANINGRGVIDIGDLSYLIDYLFISYVPLPACP